MKFIESLLTDFVRSRRQRVILNGQSSSWININAGVPQGSILGPPLFLKYINDLSDNVQCNLKLFAEDTSLSSTVKVPKRTANNLNNDLKEIKNGPSSEKWASTLTLKSKLKRSFLAERLQRKFILKIFFNNIPVTKADIQKHLGLHLDSKLSFDIHIKTI